MGLKMAKNVCKETFWHIKGHLVMKSTKFPEDFFPFHLYALSLEAFRASRVSISFLCACLESD